LFKLKNKEKLLHVLLFIVAMVSIGSASIFVRLSLASGIACAFWRLFISSALILIIISVNRRGLPKILRDLDKQEILMLIVSGFALAMHFVLWMESLFRILVAISTTIVVAYPLHLTLIELIIGKERVNIISIAGLVMGFLGIMLLFWEAFVSRELDTLGILESFIASILVAIYFYIGRLARRRIDVYTYSLYVYTVASLVVLCYSFIVEDNVFKYVEKSWIWFLLLALIPMLGGHTVMNYMLKFYRSSVVTSIAFVEPIIASILAAFVLGEVISLRQLVCLAIVLTGVSISFASELIGKI
jgi:drug/metabolite transporter (DMT)-like permease